MGKLVDMTATSDSVNARCSISRGLEVLGERWMLLIVREAMNGFSRFADFRERLGVAPDVLSDRLAKLVDHGLLATRAYREPGQRERLEYVLTPAGRDLVPVLAAIAAWGDVHVPTGFGPATVFADESSGTPARLAFVDAAGNELPVEAIRFTPGPGSLSRR